MSFLEVLPLAIVMVAGPQILSAIFLATSENWRRNSSSFIVGAAISISLIVAIAYFVGNGAVTRRTSNKRLHLVVLILLLVAMVHVYRTREQSEPPKWMGKLQTATPRFSFRLGFLLLGFFPTDILTSSAVGSFLAGNGDPLMHSIPFIMLTLLFIALPSLTLLAFGDRAEAFLPKVRGWMNTHSWVVNEVVLVFFIALTINNLVG